MPRDEVNKQTAFAVHRFWLIRATLVLLITLLVDGLVARFAPHPARYCALIASSLPLTMIVFVAIPALRQESR